MNFDVCNLSSVKNASKQTIPDDIKSKINDVKKLDRASTI